MDKIKFEEMKIQPHENEIIGRWDFVDGKIIRNHACDRIRFLIENHLKKIGTDESGWNVLYQDPNDNRYWELVYLEGDLQGGGPESLINIGNRLKKYNLQ